MTAISLFFNFLGTAQADLPQDLSGLKKLPIKPVRTITPRRITDNLPRMNRPAGLLPPRFIFDSGGSGGALGGSNAVQDRSATPGILAPGITLNSFPSLSGPIVAIPPDPEIAVGPLNIVAANNEGVLVHALDGTLLAGADWNTLLGDTTHIFFDPHVFYDEWNGRFQLWIAAWDGAEDSFWVQLFTETNDALGDIGGYFWGIPNAPPDITPGLIDFPLTGYTKDTVYVTSNIFEFGSSTFRDTYMLQLDSLSIYGGGPTGFIWYGFGLPSWCPSEMHDDPGANQNYVVVSVVSGDTAIGIATFRADWSIPDGFVDAFDTPTVTGYMPPPDAQQPGGVLPLDTTDARTTSAAFANGVLTMAHATGHDWGDGQGVRAAIQIYRINPTSPATITGEAIYGAAGFDYFFPAVNINQDGDVTVVFGRSSTTEFAGVHVTGWRNGDAAPEPSDLVKAGEDPYEIVGGGVNRYGDYFNAALDPFDGKTVWVIGEYAGKRKESGESVWGTWIAETNYKPFTAIEVENVCVPAGGGATTLKATLARTDTGEGLSGQTLEFFVDGTSAGTATTDAGGVATRNVDTTGLANGEHEVLVTFARTVDFNASVGTGSLLVGGLPTKLVVPKKKGTAGKSVILTATLRRVSDNKPLGGKTIEFFVDGVSVGTGVTNAKGVAKRKYKIPANESVGNHATRADFAGDAEYCPVSKAGVLTVKSNTVTSVDNVTGDRGTSVTLSATLTRTTDGAPLSGKKVKFFVDGALVGTGTTNASGVATLDFAIPTGMASGSHKIKAVFAGDALYNKSTGSGTLTVN